MSGEQQLEKSPATIRELLDKCACLVAEYHDYENGWRGVIRDTLRSGDGIERAYRRNALYKQWPDLYFRVRTFGRRVKSRADEWSYTSSDLYSHAKSLDPLLERVPFNDDSYQLPEIGSERQNVAQEAVRIALFELRGFLEKLSKLISDSVERQGKGVGDETLERSPADSTQTVDPIAAARSREDQQKTSVKRKRGRPLTISIEQKLRALEAKANGKSNRDCAKILYLESHPSRKRVSNVYTILAYFTKTRPTEVRSHLADNPKLKSYCEKHHRSLFEGPPSGT